MRDFHVRVSGFGCGGEGIIEAEDEVEAVQIVLKEIVDLRIAVHPTCECEGHSDWLDAHTDEVNKVLHGVLGGIEI